MSAAAKKSSKSAAKTPAKKSAPAKAAKKSETPKRKYSPRWSIGLFRNTSGRLCTVYVNADGQPMPYEEHRVNGKILFFAVYPDVKYSEARQLLLKGAARKGIKDAPTDPAPKPTKKTTSKPAAKAAKRPSAKAETAKEAKAPAKTKAAPKAADTQARAA